VDLVRADGTPVQTLSEADITPLMEHCWRPPEPFVAKAADGVTDIYGVLYLPWDLDPTRSYPVLDYIYGGPFITWVPRTFLDDGTTRGGRARALAQLGFAVVLVDGRGTPERGKDFQDVVYGNFGRNEIPDHAAALHQLAERFPYLDLDRVGVFGGSWGGYMTLRALLLEPGLFKAGFATNALVDFYDHGAVGLEGYLGLITQNPEAYAYGSNLHLVDHLEGHLLLAHATSDRNVTFSTTMKMVDALARAGKPYELLVFPEEGHLLDEPSQMYRFEMLKRFFLRHLAGKHTAAKNTTTVGGESIPG
jgi:dipeptidyl aminopeptidase/acylaminoacyl peptidase